MNNAKNYRDIGTIPSWRKKLLQIAGHLFMRNERSEDWGSCQNHDCLIPGDGYPRDLSLVMEDMWDDYLSSLAGFSRTTVYERGCDDPNDPLDCYNTVYCPIAMNGYCINNPTYNLNKYRTEYLLDHSYSSNAFGTVIALYHGDFNGLYRKIWTTDTDNDHIPEGYPCGPSGDQDEFDSYSSSQRRFMDNAFADNDWSHSERYVIFLGGCHNGNPFYTDNLAYSFIHDRAIGSIAATGTSNTCGSLQAFDPDQYCMEQIAYRWEKGISYSEYTNAQALYEAVKPGWNDNQNHPVPYAMTLEMNFWGDPWVRLMGN